MMYLILILSLFIFSCDSSETFGVHELDETNLDYYDYIAYGWQAVFDEDYELAKSYFRESLESEDVVNKNSAYVALGWTLTFSTNNLLDDQACLESDLECHEIINSLRLDAREYFDLANVNLQDALDEYVFCTEASTYTNCFEEFNVDLELGEIYLDLLEFDLGDYDFSNQVDADAFTVIVNRAEDFLLTNTEYTIADNKPPYETPFNFTYQNLAVLVSQLMLRDGNACAAEDYLIENNVCLNELSSSNLYHFYSSDANLDILGEDDCGVLFSFTFATGNTRSISDWTFYDHNDEEILVYYDLDVLHGDDMSNICPNEIVADFDGDDINDNYITYQNDSGFDNILFNITEDVKRFEIKFSTGILDIVNHVLSDNSDVMLFEGCYDRGALLDDSSDDQCFDLCPDIDEDSIFRCLGTNISD